jgi:hypothetical protein
LVPHGRDHNQGGEIMKPNGIKTKGNGLKILKNIEQNGDGMMVGAIPGDNGGRGDGGLF